MSICNIIRLGGQNITWTTKGRELKEFKLWIDFNSMASVSPAQQNLHFGLPTYSSDIQGPLTALKIDLNAMQG